MSVKEKIRNGAMVKMTDDTYYVAFIGGVYGTPGYLSQLGGCDHQPISNFDDIEIEAIYEVDDICDGIYEMLYVVEDGGDVEEDFHAVYKKPKVKEMTVAEIERELGYQIKVIKEDK